MLRTLILVSLTIWAGGNAVYVAAPDLSTALIWRKVSVLGWGTVFSLLLHLVMQAAGNQKLLKKPAILALIYLPSAVNVFFYLFHSPVADAQFHMVRREGMWVNQWVNSPLNIFYTAYYILFLCASLYFLFKWYRKTASRKEKGQVRLLIISLLAALLLSLYLNTAFQESAVMVVVAQSAVIVALLPVMAAVHIVRQGTFENMGANARDRQQGVILSSKARTQTYRVAGIALFLLSYMAFYTGSLSIPVFVLSDTRWGNILMGSLLMVAAQLVYSLDRMRLSIKHQETLLLLVFIVVDLFLFVRFASIGAVTSWSSIMLIILTGIVFNNIMLVMAGGAIHILFMLVTAVLYPEIETSINVEDHVWRVMIVGAAMALAYVVNRIYRKGLRENDEFAGMQSAISEFALLLSEGSMNEYGKRTSAAMAAARKYLQPDLLLVLEGTESYAASAAMLLRPLPKLVNPEGGALEEGLGWLMQDAQYMDSISDICIRVADFNDSAAASKRQLQQAGIHRLILARLNTQDRDRCMVMLMNDEKRAMARQVRNHEFVSTLASIMTSYIRRITSEVELEYQAYYDSLTGVLKRERFIQLCEQQLAQANNGGSALGLLFLDLNGFKRVNDLAGHKAGDRVLREISSRLLSKTRASDLIGRYGGDEFLVLVTRENEEEIKKAGLMLQQTITYSFIAEGKKFHISAALGLAMATGGVSSVDRLINQADEAMYLDKARTRVNN